MTISEGITYINKHLLIAIHSVSHIPVHLDEEGSILNLNELFPFSLLPKFRCLPWVAGDLSFQEHCVLALHLTGSPANAISVVEKA